MCAGLTKHRPLLCKTCTEHNRWNLISTRASCRHATPATSGQSQLRRHVGRQENAATVDTLEALAKALQVAALSSSSSTDGAIRRFTRSTTDCTRTHAIYRESHCRACSVTACSLQGTRKATKADRCHSPMFRGFHTRRQPFCRMTNFGASRS